MSSRSRPRSPAATIITASTQADGTSDDLGTFDDYSGSPTQHTNPGWDDVTGLGVPDGIFTP